MDEDSKGQDGEKELLESRARTRGWEPGPVRQACEP